MRDRTVLLVEDDDLSARGTARLLRSTGLTVTRAASCAEALGLALGALDPGAPPAMLLTPEPRDDDEARRWRVAVALAARGLTTAQLAREMGAHRSLVQLLVTRGWEPPTGELADFLETARELWPGATRIALLPLAVEPGAALPDHQLSQWLRFSERRQDPLLQVATATGLTGSGSKTRGAAS